MNIGGRRTAKVKGLLSLALFLSIVFFVLLAIHTWLRFESVTGLLLKIFVGVTIAVLIYYGMRSLVLTQRRAMEQEGMVGGELEGEESGKKDTAGFVIETFQTLIQRLKEKEQELERLKRVAEERADHIESYNENILRSVSSGVITFNQQEVITSFNLAAERILGWVASSVIGRPCGDVFGKGSQITRLVQNALNHKEVTIRKELELVQQKESEDQAWPVRARGVGASEDPVSSLPHGPPQASDQTGRRKWEKIWVGVSTSLLMDKQDRVIGTTMVFTDLSEIKRLQEQVELKKRLTLLGEMSAGIAHEFRNYMGTIMGYAKLLAKKAGPEFGASGMIQSIIHELESMAHLINELLDFSKSTELNLQPVDLGMLIEKVVHQMFEQAKGPVPKLTLIFSPRLGKVQLDEVLIRQAVGNIIQNALEAMPNGGELKIQVGLRPRPTLSDWGSGPRQAVARGPASGLASDGPGRGGIGGATAPHGPPPINDQEVEIEIQDTGVGIPPEVQDKIFLPFFTTKEKGTGLGLALVHKIILSHNGQIQVDSQESKGTAFRVYLPYEREG